MQLEKCLDNISAKVQLDMLTVNILLPTYELIRRLKSLNPGQKLFETCLSEVWYENPVK